MHPTSYLVRKIGDGYFTTTVEIENLTRRWQQWASLLVQEYLQQETWQPPHYAGYLFKGRKVQWLFIKVYKIQIFFLPSLHILLECCRRMRQFMNLEVV